MAKCCVCGAKEAGSHGDHVREMHPIACSKVPDLFERYASRMLGVADDERMICHLAECAACSAQFAEFGQRKLAVHGGGRTSDQKTAAEFPAASGD